MDPERDNMVDANDDISITSTADSNKKDEYEVGEILSELQFKDGIRYLVRWEGYPLERCTWEPRDSFYDTQTLADWERKKAAIAEGKVAAFDVKAWENYLKDLEKAKNERKRRRREKRIRLGLEPSGRQTSRAGLPNRPLIQRNGSSQRSNTKQSSRQRPASPQVQPDSPVARTISPSFGTPNSIPSPAPFPRARRKRRSAAGWDDPSLARPYKLATQRLLFKSKFDEPAPDVNMLELKRPQEWLSENRNPLELVASGPSYERPAPTGYDPFTIPNTDPDSSASQNSIDDTVFTAPNYNPPVTIPMGPRGSVAPAQNSSNTTASTKDNPVMDPTNSENSVSQNSSNMLASTAPSGNESSTSFAGQNAFAAQNSVNPADSADNLHPSRRLQMQSNFSSSTNELSDTIVSSNDLGNTNDSYPTFDPTKVSARPFKSGQILVTVYYGPDKRALGQAKICGASHQTKAHLVRTRKSKTNEIEIWFRYLCTRSQYEALCYASNRLYCNGYFTAYKDTKSNLDKMTEDLRHKDVVGIYYSPNAPQYVLLAFHETSSFSFLSQEPKQLPSEGASLRLAVRDGLQPYEKLSLIQQGMINASAPPKNASPLVSLPDQAVDTPVETATPPIAYNQEPNNIKPPAVRDSSSRRQSKPASNTRKSIDFDLDAFFKSHFSITFDVLAAVNTKKTLAKVFYLWLPSDPANWDEANVLIEFLKKHGAMIYSSRNPDDWERFTNPEDGDRPGVVLFYRDFTDFHTVESFISVIRKPVSFWAWSLSAPLNYFKHPTHFQRIFPHGAVILITEDFMINDPEGTLVILGWFCDLGKFPGSWRIMLRPGVMNWLLKQDDTDAQGTDGRWIAMYQLILKLNWAGHISTDPDDEDNIYQLFNPLSKHIVMSPAEIPGYGSPFSLDRPGAMGLTQTQRDADILVEFFAGWAILNCHRFRRFVIVTNERPLPRWEEWNHMEIRDGKRFFRHFGIDYHGIMKKLRSGDGDISSKSTSVVSGEQARQQQLRQPPRSVPDQQLPQTSQSLSFNSEERPGQQQLRKPPPSVPVDSEGPAREQRTRQSPQSVPPNSEEQARQQQSRQPPQPISVYSEGPIREQPLPQPPQTVPIYSEGPARQQQLRQAYQSPPVNLEKEPGQQQLRQAPQSVPANPEEQSRQQQSRQAPQYVPEAPRGPRTMGTGSNNTTDKDSNRPSFDSNRATVQLGRSPRLTDEPARSSNLPSPSLDSRPRYPEGESQPRPQYRPLPSQKKRAFTITAPRPSSDCYRPPLSPERSDRSPPGRFDRLPGRSGFSPPRRFDRPPPGRPDRTPPGRFDSPPGRFERFERFERPPSRGRSDRPPPGRPDRPSPPGRFDRSLPERLGRITIPDSYRPGSWRSPTTSDTYRPSSRRFDP